MKISEYNEMMAYMLRPPQKQNTQTADLVDDLEPGSLRDELLKDFDPSQETYEEYLQRKSMRENAAQGGVIGKDGMFKGQDMGTREGFSRLDKILKMNKEIKKTNLKTIKDFIKNFKLQNGRLPKMVELEEGTGFSRSTISRKGLKPGVDYLTMGESQKLRIRDLPEEQIKVIDYVKDLPDGTIINRPLIQKYINDNNLDINLERFFTKDAQGYLPNHITNKKVKFDPTYRGRVGDTKQYKKSKEILNDPVLKEKFIKFANKPNIKQKDILKKFNISGAEFFEGGLRQILPKDIFIKYNQGKLFDYLLNSKDEIDLKQVAKDLKMTQEGVKKSSRNLYQNIYKAFDPDVKKSRVLLDLGYNSEQLKNVANKIKTFPSDYHDRTLEKLLIDAYGETPKKLKPLLDKLEKFRELQKELPEKYQKFFTANFDHVIPFNFLKQIKDGKNPENLIRVKAYPEFLNQGAFKANIDRVLNQAKDSKDKKLIKTITELQKYLPQDLGKIDSKGKRVIDYKAKPFNLKTLYSEQQKKFGEVYERTQKFIENPKVIDLLKDAGISLKAISQIKRLNVPGFFNTFNKILQRRPDLRVELGDEYSDIENQYASASMMSDVSPQPKKEMGIPAEAIPATAAAAYKFGKPALKTAAKVIRPLGFPSVAGGLSLSNILDYEKPEDASVLDRLDPRNYKVQDDPDLKTAGLDLLLPEILKKAAPRGSGIMSMIGRGLANPFGRAARAFTPVGATLTAAGIGKDYYDFAKDEIAKVKAMTPEERGFYNDLLMDEGGLLDWSEKSQDHHQNQGQHHRGWILIIILLRQWNWRK